MSPLPETSGALALGRQLTIEYYDCDPHILADVRRMEEIFLAAAHRSRAHVVQSFFHEFTPQGVSGVVIISESHFTVHAWPEYDYAAVDIFTCGDVIDFDAAAESLRRDLKAGNMAVSCAMDRGIVNPLGVEHLVSVCEDRDRRAALSWKKNFDRISAHGISVSLDFYDCRDLSESRLKQAALDFGALLGSSPCEEFRFRQDAYGAMQFSQDFANGRFAGYFAAEKGAVYLDLAAFNGYFEPRTAAEKTLQDLGGHHYRMQVAIRQ